jgi:saccharopine dehydrogenase-like NADP-dependent oxidoreductase
VSNSEPVMVPLSSPVEAHGETLHALAIRQPTGKDLRVMGLPFTLSTDGQMVQIDGKAMHRAIAMLADVPPSTVDRLHARDFLAASGVVAGFFGEGPG